MKASSTPLRPAQGVRWSCLRDLALVIAGILVAGCGRSGSTDRASPGSVNQGVPAEHAEAIEIHNNQPASAPNDAISPGSADASDATGSNAGGPELNTRDSNTLDDASRSPDVDQAARDKIIANSQALASQGALDRASEELRKLLLVNPADAEVLFRLAAIEAQSGDLAEAVALLDEIPDDHPEAGIAALGQSADWCLQLERYDDAEMRYRKVVARLPNASLAHRQLAQLLNRQGRRHEAATHIRELCRLGDIRQDELQSLIVLNDAMSDSQGDTSSGGIDYSPLGAFGKARQRLTERRYAEAADLLRDSVADGSAYPAAIAMYGLAVAEAQDEQAFKWWLGKTDDDVREFSEYWAALGVHLADNRQHDTAARALLEAIDRDPTDFRSINRLLRVLEMLGRDEEVKRWEKRWRDNREILRASNTISRSQSPDVDAMAELSSRLIEVDRKLEAVMWKLLEAYYRKLPQEFRNQLNSERQTLVANDTGFPDRSARICQMDLDAFNLPNLRALQSEAVVKLGSPRRTEIPTSPASFTNVAEQVGIRHAYLVGTEEKESGFLMYQQMGGGVAAVDYDLDGNLDLYFAQGAAMPPEFISQTPNPIYRNEGGTLRDVAGDAIPEGHRYTLGCTSGDWNQDGFPDLVSANIGENHLLINNGDGTFTKTVIAGSNDLQRMPASVAIADFSGDAIPDLFQVNYLQDPELLREPERNDDGEVIDALGPLGFDPALDRIGINDGTGETKLEPISNDPDSARPGLGLVIGDFEAQGGNEILVGNDSAANQYWVRQVASETWSDVAVAKGIAFSSGGAGTASMGIAAWDFDQSGTLDFHIANFQDEPVCLYLGRDGFYQDRALQYGLGPPSFSVLGFGSQALDYDNNGLSDLLVTNGHIDRYVKMTGSFRQLPQLFCNRGDRFEAIEVEDPSNYWQAPHLGRAMARLDFNRDGKMDIVITHIQEPSALLINTTESSNHWIQFHLVGTASERDAIGSQLRIRVGDEVQWGWVTTGDGYLCRNETVVGFGLGSSTRVDELEVRWPSGIRQTFRDLPGDRRLLVIENEAQAYPFQTP